MSIKTLNIPFNEPDYNLLKSAKEREEKSWHNFILQLTERPKTKGKIW